MSNEAGAADDGTTMLPTTPFETLVFGRGVPHKPHPSRRRHEMASAGTRAR